MLIWIDGERVAIEAATISVRDRGLLYGEGVFETLRTWDGALVDLDAHLDRLYGAAAALALAMRPRAELADATAALVADALRMPAAEPDRRIRIVVTRGPGPLATPRAQLGPGRTIIDIDGAIGEPPAELSAAIVDWPLPRRAVGVKTLAYLDHVIARELAIAAGAQEAIRLDADGHAVEGATSNLFAVIGGAVVTAPIDLGILPGTMRRRVIATCERLAIPVREVAIGVAELRSADEVFVTTSLRGVVPVTRLDGVPRAAGPITARLAATVRDELRTLASSHPRVHSPGGAR